MTEKPSGLFCRRIFFFAISAYPIGDQRGERHNALPSFKSDFSYQSNNMFPYFNNAHNFSLLSSDLNNINFFHFFNILFGASLVVDGKY
jgi:hypothetical protein